MRHSRGSHDVTSFRGSMARLGHSLSTLRSAGHPDTTQDSLPAAGQALPGGLLPAGFRRKVSALHLFPLSQAFLCTKRRPQHRHPLRRRPLPQGPAHAAPDQGRGHPPGRPRRPAPRRCRASGRCGSRASWPSCRASATRTPTARTSSRWTSGSRPTPSGHVTTGWLGRAAAELRQPIGRRADPAHRPEPPAAGPGRGAGRRGGQRQRPELVPPRAGRRQGRPAAGAPQADRGPGGAARDGRARTTWCRSCSGGRCRR